MDAMLQIQYLIKRVRTSTGYFYFSICQLILCLSLLIYVLFDPYQHLQEPSVLWMEVFIAYIVFIDITIRIVAEKQMYFRNMWNVFDLASFFVIVVVLSMFFSAELNQQLDESAEEDDIIGLSLIAARYVIQIIRLVLMIQKSHLNRQMHENALNDIDLEAYQDKNVNESVQITSDNKQYMDIKPYPFNSIEEEHHPYTPQQL